MSPNKLAILAGLMLLSSSISSAPSTSTRVGRSSMRELVRVAVTSTSCVISWALGARSSVSRPPAAGATTVRGR